jgi:hypothetical protein
MTEPVTLALASIAASVGLTTLYLSRPRPPALDAALWFKMLLANVLVGRVESADGDAEAWRAAVEAQVPAPSDVEPERLLAWPGDTLGRAYDPKTWTTQHDWADVNAIGRGESALLETLVRRTRATWVLVGDDEGPAVLDALEGRVDAVRAEATVDALVATLERYADASRQLPSSLVLVFVASGAAIRPVLELLHGERGVRDLTAAVVGVHPSLDAAWMAEHFVQRAMDREKDVPTDFLALQWDDGDASLARFPQPDSELYVRDHVMAHDLGVLPRSSDPTLVADALALLVGLWLLAAAA